MAWKEAKAWTHVPRPDVDADFACSFMVRRGSEEVQSTVEFAAGPSDTSQRVVSARKVLAPYLENDDEKPPRRLCVGRDGSVSIRERADD